MSAQVLGTSAGWRGLRPLGERLVFYLSFSVQVLLNQMDDVIKFYWMVGAEVDDFKTKRFESSN
jgi:hypothetical protein